MGVVYDRTDPLTLEGQYSGRVYLVYTDEEEDQYGVPETDDTDIYVIYSNDDGETWSPDEDFDPEPVDPVRVNDDVKVPEEPKSQFLPRIALDQTSGVIAVSWHDCRDDDGGTGPGNRMAGPNNDTQFFAAISDSGGARFYPNVQVSEGTSDEAAANVEGQWFMDYGDYTGLAFHDGYYYPAWADNSNSTLDNPDNEGSPDYLGTTMDIYTARVVPEPDQLLALSSGIVALWGLSFLRVRDRGLGRRLG